MVTKRYRLVISIYATSAHLMNFLNVYFIFTASHYTEDFTLGILINKFMSYDMYPILEAVDVVFALLIIAITVAIIIACGRLKNGDDTGIYIAIGCDIALLFSSIFYPLLTALITGLNSPMLTFCICQILVFTIISVATSIYFLKANYII